MIDPEGKEHQILNQNVLIEIGVAQALYGKNIILLVEKGAQLHLICKDYINVNMKARN